jgi:asparaginyl-tRNA synthetase
LTVSSQLHGEIGACSLGRVFTFGPIFRAEKHHTKRHLSEFWMLEPEIAFIDNLNSLQGFIEDYLKCVTKELAISCKDDIENCLKHAENPRLTEKRILDLQSKPFGHIQYKDAVELLRQSGEEFKFPVKWGLALQTEHEKYLAEKIFDGPVFITDYPEAVKAFYMKSNDSKLDHNGLTVACLDLIFPEIGEVAGGSIRENRLEILESKLSKFDLDPVSLDWYLDLRRFGSVPHGGFGLGFDRYLQYVTGTSNIRDVTLIPRHEGSNKY